MSPRQNPIKEKNSVIILFVTISVRGPLTVVAFVNIQIGFKKILL